MSNDNRTSLKASHKAADTLKTSPISLLLRFIKFMAWVIIIGLLLSPLACTVEQSKITNEQQGGDYE